MIVAVDIGSGSVRAGIVTAEGVEFIARSGGALAIVPGSLIGLDLELLWARVVHVLDEVAAAAREQGIRVEAITCTSIRYATVWQSPRGTTAWANLARADQSDVEELQSLITVSDLADLGGWPTALSLSTRLRTARRHGIAPEPGSVAMSVGAWVLSRLGAEPHIDPVSWSDARARRVDVLCAAPIRAVGEVVGVYDGSVGDTRDWQGARLCVSPPDTVSALHAFEDVGAGDVLAVAGTTTPVLAVADHGYAPEFDLSDDHSWLPFRDEQVLAESNAARTGDVVQSLSRLLRIDEAPRPCPVVHAVGSVRAFLGPTLVPPRSLGGRVMPQSLEFVRPFADADAYALLQSVVEANAWATHEHMRRVEKQVRARRRRMVCGGQARSEDFLRFLASASCMPVYATTEEVTLLGAARAVTDRKIMAVKLTRIDPNVDVSDEVQRWVSRWWELYSSTQRREVVADELQ